MKIAGFEITIKDGRKVLFRSPEVSDAQQMLVYLRQVSSETNYMIRYPDEVTYSIEMETGILDRYISAERDFMISAVSDGKVVGNVGVSSVGEQYKLRHRASVGIAVVRDFWKQGIGMKLLSSAIDTARENGFEQIELGVYADNLTALSLYRKLGFQETGRIPRAFRMRDGSYIDEIQMVRVLTDRKGTKC